MKKVWIKKANSFKEADKFNVEYNASMLPGDRIEAMQLLREICFKIKSKKNENRKRLRRVIKVIQ